MPTPVIRGLFPAFPTPLKADGTLDETALARLVEYQISRGASGLVPVGGTGEATSLPAAIRKRVVERTVQFAAKRVPVVAGVLDPGLGGVLDSCGAYQDAGADAVMIIPPYYARPDQDGVIRYFRAIADSIRLPIVFYDNPFRTNSVVSAATIARLVDERRIVGMKASSFDLYHLGAIARLVGPEFAILSGQDTVFVHQVIAGARGGVLTSAALLPGYWADVQAMAETGRTKEALEAQSRLNPLMDALFSEQFPEAVRVAFELIGLPLGRSLPPVDRLSSAARSKLESAVSDLMKGGLLQKVD